jgi:hypothetical protein
MFQYYKTVEVLCKASKDLIHARKLAPPLRVEINSFIILKSRNTINNNVFIYFSNYTYRAGSTCNQFSYIETLFFILAIISILTSVFKKMHKETCTYITK